MTDAMARATARSAAGSVTVMPPTAAANIWAEAGISTAVRQARTARRRLARAGSIPSVCGRCGPVPPPLPGPSSACTSTSSGRRPCRTGTTTLPGTPAIRSPSSSGPGSGTARRPSSRIPEMPTSPAGPKRCLTTSAPAGRGGGRRRRRAPCRPGAPRRGARPGRRPWSHGRPGGGAHRSTSPCGSGARRRCGPGPGCRRAAPARDPRRTAASRRPPVRGGAARRRPRSPRRRAPQWPAGSGAPGRCARPAPHLGQRLLGRGQHDVEPGGRQRRQHLEEQGRLADAGGPEEQRDRPGHHAAAHDPVQLADPRGQRVRAVGRDVDQGEAPGGPSPCRTRCRGVPAPGRACSTPRRRGTVRPIAARSPRRPRRGMRRRHGAARAGSHGVPPPRGGHKTGIVRVRGALRPHRGTWPRPRWLVGGWMHRHRDPDHPSGPAPRRRRHPRRRRGRVLLRRDKRSERGGRHRPGHLVGATRPPALELVADETGRRRPSAGGAGRPRRRPRTGRRRGTRLRRRGTPRGAVSAAH